MKIIQAIKNDNEDWHYLQEKVQVQNPLVLVFGIRYLLEDENRVINIKKECTRSPGMTGDTHCCPLHAFTWRVCVWCYCVCDSVRASFVKR